MNRQTRWPSHRPFHVAVRDRDGTFLDPCGRWATEEQREEEQRLEALLDLRREEDRRRRSERFERSNRFFLAFLGIPFSVAAKAWKEMKIEEARREEREISRWENEGGA